MMLTAHILLSPANQPMPTRICIWKNNCDHKFFFQYFTGILWIKLKNNIILIRCSCWCKNFVYVHTYFYCYCSLANQNKSSIKFEIICSHPAPDEFIIHILKIYCIIYNTKALWLFAIINNCTPITHTHTHIFVATTYKSELLLLV